MLHVARLMTSRPYSSHTPIQCSLHRTDPPVFTNWLHRSLKTLCLASWAVAPCVWMLRALTRNLLTYLLTYHWPASSGFWCHGGWVGGTIGDSGPCQLRPMAVISNFSPTWMFKQHYSIDKALMWWKFPRVLFPFLQSSPLWFPVAS